RRPGAERGRARGTPGRPADRAVPDRVQAAAVPADQRRPGGEQGADPGPGVELRLRRGGADRRVVRVLPPPQDRHRWPAADPYGARRRVRVAAAPGRGRVIGRLPRPWRRWTLRTRLVVAMALLAGCALVLADVASLLQLRSSLLGGV